MKSLIQTALDLGWTLIAYEADFKRWPGEHGGHPLMDEEAHSIAFTNWREKQQAENLRAALDALPPGSKMVVWCGNGHLEKTTISDWLPMGYWFTRIGGFEPFTIDQTVTIRFDPAHPRPLESLAARYQDALRLHGGTAGFFRDEGPAELRKLSSDAFILSLNNDLE